ncbi:hypothetical protein D3C87_886890 [compost metagenome]
MLWFFFALLTLIFIFSLLSLRQSHHPIGAALHIYICVVIILFAGLRGGDRDFFVYQEIYEATPLINDFSLEFVRNIHGEIGYLLLSSLLKSIGLGFNFFLLAIATLSVSLIAVSTYRLSPIPLLSMAIYFSHFFILREMMQVRAGLSIAILLYFLSSYKNIFLVFLGVIIASLFHSGALIIIPFLPFLNNRAFISFKLYLCTFILCVILGNIGFLNILLTYFSDIGLLPKAINNYIGWSLYDYKLPVFTNPVTWKAIFIIYIMGKIESEVIGSFVNRLRILYSYGLLFMVLFSDMAILAGRLSTFLFCAENILIVWALTFCAKKKHITILGGGVIAFMQLAYDLMILRYHDDYRVFFL